MIRSYFLPLHAPAHGKICDGKLQLAAACDINIFTVTLICRCSLAFIVLTTKWTEKTPVIIRQIPLIDTLPFKAL